MKNNYLLSVLVMAVLSIVLMDRPIWADEQATHMHAMPMGSWDAKNMQKDLGLSDDQTTQLNAAMTDQKNAMKDLSDNLTALMKKLADQVKNKASDMDLTATLNDIDANHKTMMDTAEKFRAQ